MTLTAGTKLGSYEITGAIGAGGMGEVYRSDRRNKLKNVAEEMTIAMGTRLGAYEIVALVGRRAFQQGRSDVTEMSQP